MGRGGDIIGRLEREDWSVVRSIPASLPEPSLRYRYFRK
jgi:hypothetical protein